MIKSIDQKEMAKWILILGVLFSVVAYVAGAKQFSYGLLFGSIICIINYYIIDLVLGFMISFSTKTIAKILGFVGYHARFWVLVILLFFIIVRQENLFIIGFFAAMLLAKIIMGAMLICDTGDEWWNKRKI